ncbi:putative signal transducing protein [Mangrovibacterium lignilyticum]|uniref:putative signal transducing protein n=1 Tax=Mangrovibacterium lignilyticum TaxID=2668052 RepID=UPI0013D70955|nr:DUF2007 domain-containing protein [Mangrovibacterium lignilyticum]
MSQENSMIIVFTGGELIAALLKAELDKQGISSLIQNDFNSGIMAGFSGGVPSAADLYIQKKDLEKAKPIIRDLVQELDSL